ncbi:hypothetical protein CsSME_00031969 [Camellia sinensis var. sinensis]
MEAIGGGGGGEASMAMASTRGIVVRRAGLVGDDAGDRKAKAKAERMFALMDGFLKNDPISLQRDILDHVEYTVARSRFSFDDFEAYQGRVEKKDSCIQHHLMGLKAWLGLVWLL